MDKGFGRRVAKEVTKTLLEIKSGDIMATYAAIWGAIVAAAAIILAQKNFWSGVILLALSPIPILTLTVFTRIVLERITKRLEMDEIEGSERKISPLIKKLLSADPRRKELAYQIAVEAQKFRTQFELYKTELSRESSNVRFRETNKIVENMYSELLPRAKLMLGGTSISRLMTHIHSLFKLYDLSIAFHSSTENKRMDYIREQTEIPQEFTDGLNEANRVIDETADLIDSLAIELIELCQEIMY